MATPRITEAAPPTVPPPNRAHELAATIEALHRCREDFAETKKDFAARIEALENRVSQISREILTGQRSIFDAEAVLDAVAEEVNSGALDTGTTTVRATVRHGKDAATGDNHVD